MSRAASPSTHCCRTWRRLRARWTGARGCKRRWLCRWPSSAPPSPPCPRPDLPPSRATPAARVARLRQHASAQPPHPHRVASKQRPAARRRRSGRPTPAAGARGTAAAAQGVGAVTRETTEVVAEEALRSDSVTAMGEHTATQAWHHRLSPGLPLLRARRGSWGGLYPCARLALAGEAVVGRRPVVGGSAVCGSHCATAVQQHSMKLVLCRH